MRIRKGQTLEAAFPQPNLSSPLSLASIDSPFQLQEYLSLLIRQDPHNVEQIVSLPEGEFSQNQATFSPTNPKGKGRDPSSSTSGFGNGNGNGDMMGMGEDELHSVDTDVWIYEQLRRIVLDFSHPWLVTLQQVCSSSNSPTTCSAMYAGDWMYLCACHGEEKQCCAIDYMIHTLDGTSALLNSARHFPSRTFIPNTSLRHFGSVARRLSRIFVHAWGHHRECFESCEAETSLYARFYTLAERYDLVQLEDLPPINSTSSTSSTSETNSRIPDSSAFSPREPNSNSQDFSTTSSSTSDQPIVARILKRGSDELPDQSTTSLDRNDSNASRLTAIRIGKEKKKIEGEGIEETLEEGFKKLDLEKEESGEEEIPKSLDSAEMVGNERRELSADEAPTEVKDEEDVEDQDEEQGGELETESQVQRQESTQNQEELSEPVESESSKVENQDRKQVEPQESSLLFLSPSI